MGKKTALYDQHILLSAQMVEFAGYDMPLHYGSQLNEHHYVRKHAGIFDVSHMNIVDIEGEKTSEFLSILLANDINKLYDYKALYTCMLNPSGGVIDDLIVYKINNYKYRLVLNAGTKEKDLNWINKHADSSLSITPREDLSIIALQGPHALKIIESVFSGGFGGEIASLKPFNFICKEETFVARTGYTGENGFELIIKNNNAVHLWRMLLDAGAHPIGLGARDTLRLEAGLNLYGQDMDESTSPYESNLGWTIDLENPDRNFIGKTALLNNKSERKLVGLILDKGGILRHGQKVLDNQQEIGEITSGGFSPTLNCSIALARMVNRDLTEAEVKIRDKLLPIKITQPVFVRKGKAV